LSATVKLWKAARTRNWWLNAAGTTNFVWRSISS